MSITIIDPSAVFEDESQLLAGKLNPKAFNNRLSGPVALYMYNQIIEMTTIDITDGRK
jgi:hypothetical protein